MTKLAISIEVETHAVLTTLVCRYCAAVDAVSEAGYNSAD